MVRARVLVALALVAVARNVAAQSPVAALKIAHDSIRAETCRGGTLSASGLTCTGAKLAPRVTVLRRLANRADSIARAWADGDTLVLPAPSPSPAPTLTLTLEPTATDTILRVRPRLPNIIFIRARVESAGVVVSDSAAFTVSDTLAARLYPWLGGQRRAQYSNADSTRPSSTVTITGRWGSATASVRIRVETPCCVTPPPPDTTTPPPPPPPPLGKLVQVDVGRTFQTISGWQGGSLTPECPGYAGFRDALVARLVDLGMTRKTVGVWSGSENDQDYWTLWQQGLLPDTAWRRLRHSPTNDNADPAVAAAGRFHWAFLDSKVTHEILPLRAGLAARGESLYWVLTVTDFRGANHGNETRPFELLQQPAEYAEFVTQAFLHLQQRFGLVPNAVEIVLEPENLKGSDIDGTDLGRAIIAARARLAAQGFTPEMVAPSTASMWNGHLYYDQAVATGGRPEWLAYHRYIAVSDSALQRIGARASATTRTAMLEYNASGSPGEQIDNLIADLTVGQVSAWMQFSASACGPRDNVDNPGVYLQVNVTDSLTPRINMTTRAALLRQVFAYVRPGAVRVGATSGDSVSLKPVAFRNLNGGLVTVVRTRTAQTFGVRGLPPGSYAITYALEGDTARVALPPVTKSDQADVQVSIPGAGVLTIAGTSAPVPGPTPPPDSTPPPPPLPIPADTLLRAPELPRAVPSFPASLSTRPCTDRPTTTAGLQAALGAGGARTICLTPGTTLIGAWDVPARAAGDTAWSVLRSDMPFTFGQRIAPNAGLARLVAGADLRFPVLWFHARAARWLVQGVEITTDSTFADSTIDGNRLALVEAHERISPATGGELPRDIHFSHVDLHGWLRQQVKVGFYLNGIGHVIRDSRCTEIHQRNADSQCVLSVYGPGPFLIENSLLEAASENIMFGGGDPGITGLVPSDITIRGNLIRKPVAWKAIGTPTQSGSYNVKLLLEAKNASRVLVEGNRMDGSWLDGQTGYAIGLKSVNQEGACRWCRVTDWTIRGNTIVNVGAVLGFAGRPEQFRTDPSNPGHPVDTALSRIAFIGNWVDSMNVAPYVGDARGALLGWQAADINISRNTFAGGNWTREAIIFDTSNPLTRPGVTRFRFDDNIIPYGQYGVAAAAFGQGTVALSGAVAGGWSFAGNVFTGPKPDGWAYPTGTRWVPDLTAALATGAGIPARPVP